MELKGKMYEIGRKQGITLKSNANGNSKRDYSRLEICGKQENK